MANEKNLIPFSKRSKSEARENGKKGGKNSGATRRRKRDLKACANLILDLPAYSDIDFEILKEFKINLDNKDDIDNKLVVTAALIQRAKMGDVSAIKELRNITEDDYQFKQKLALEKQKVKLLEEKLHGTDNLGQEDTHADLIKALTQGETNDDN